MRTRRWQRIWMALLIACCAQQLGLAAPAVPPPPSIRHLRLCDASAAVALDIDRVVVADDERNSQGEEQKRRRR